jgi:hypothetical protein
VIASRLQRYLIVALEAVPADCPFNWSLASPVVHNGTFSKLSLFTTIKCSVKGTLEQLIIRFPTPTPIHDPQGNKLATNWLKAPLRRRVYIAQEEAAVVSATGTAMAFSTLTTFLISIIPALLRYRVRWLNS